MAAMSACPRNSSYSIRAGLVPKFTGGLQGGGVWTTNIPTDPIGKGFKENMIVGKWSLPFPNPQTLCMCVYIYIYVCLDCYEIILETQIPTPFPNHSYKIFITDCCPAVEPEGNFIRGCLAAGGWASQQLQIFPCKIWQSAGNGTDYIYIYI